MCILCRVYILTYNELYFCFSIPSFVVYTNIMLKDKKYKKFMQCIRMEYGVGRFGMVCYVYGLGILKNILKPNAFAFVALGTIFT